MHWQPDSRQVDWRINRSIVFRSVNRFMHNGWRTSLSPRICKREPWHDHNMNCLVSNATVSTPHPFMNVRPRRVISLSIRFISNSINLHPKLIPHRTRSTIHVPVTPTSHRHTNNLLISTPILGFCTCIGNLEITKRKGKCHNRTLSSTANWKLAFMIVALEFVKAKFLSLWLMLDMSDYVIVVLGTTVLYLYPSYYIITMYFYHDIGLSTNDLCTNPYYQPLATNPDV